ncbi:hypothetical protein V8F20_009029 [Naviculisporaceae sp. PSN 640]
MYISKATKAIFILVNYVTANLVPPHLKINVRLDQGAEGDNFVHDVDLAADSTSITPAATKTPMGLLLPRQKTCDRCRKRCPTGKVINPFNCRRCVRCAPGKKADPTFTICVNGTPEPDKEETDKRSKDKERVYKVKKRIEQHKHKLKTYYVKKAKERRKYQANEQRKKDNERRKKVRRAGRCLPIVPLAMGASVAAEYADEFFDEAYIESMDLEQFWPDDLPVEPWNTDEDDKIFEDDEYLDEWVEVGNSKAKSSASVSGSAHDVEIKAARQPEAGLQLAPPSSGAEGNGEIEARFLPFLIPIFAAVAGTAIRVGVAAGRAGGAVLKLTRYTVKIGKGKGSKKSYKEQSDGARRIAKDKNWRNCLTRRSPSA